MSKRRILIAVFATIFLLLFLLAGYMRQNYIVPILMYHSVNPDARPENRLAVSVKAFERQIHFLKNNHYRVLPLDSVADLIKENRKIPPKTVAITFDDGYKDNYTYAFPVLKKYGLPATIFVIINEVGRTDRLSWDEIKTMQDSGIINFGSHALAPEPLINIQSEDELRKEIFDSKKILEEKLGRRITVFSYPGGMSNSKIRQLVIDAGYKFAVATNPGKKFVNDDLLALKRLRISSSSNNLFVFWVEVSGYYNFIREHRHK
jgi:peptidoglycan/xylan/chitin deacetylase (PgdA/CDA1 family)